MKIVKGDTVVVVAGKEKGKTGKVISVDRQRGRVMVEKLNMVKRHQRPNPQRRQSGIVEKEASLHISNVMIQDAKTGKHTRVGMKLEKGKKIRVAKRSGEPLPSVRS